MNNNNRPIALPRGWQQLPPTRAFGALFVSHIGSLTLTANYMLEDRKTAFIDAAVFFPPNFPDGPLKRSVKHLARIRIIVEKDKRQLYVDDLQGVPPTMRTSLPGGESLRGLARRALKATVRLARAIDPEVDKIRLLPEPTAPGMRLNNLRAMYARMSFRPNGDIYMTTTIDEFLNARVTPAAPAAAPAARRSSARLKAATRVTR